MICLNMAKNSAVSPSLPGDSFVWEIVDFRISSKDLFTSQRLDYSLDIFFLSDILLKTSVVAVLEVVSLV